MKKSNIKYMIIWYIDLDFSSSLNLEFRMNTIKFKN